MVMMQKQKFMKPIDFEAAWKTKLSPFLKKKIAHAHLRYREVSDVERDEYIRLITKSLLSKSVVSVGGHRRAQWQSGWAENLDELTRTRKISAIVPHYFGKHPVNRFSQRFVIGLHKDFEVGMLSILEYWVFEKYLKTVPIVYEFGCGTGHNLLRLRELNKGAELWGLDWVVSSQRLIQSVAKILHDSKLMAQRFDFFHPDKMFALDRRGAIFTMAALEQTGKRYKPFVNYILKNKPALCVHIEPTGETLNPKHLLDFLSIEYFKKRKYLDGFIAYLRELETRGKAKILSVQRSYIGSYYIDGYSIIVWKPL